MAEGPAVSAIQVKMVSDWFPATQHPEHVGWYEVEAPWQQPSSAFAKWDGRTWLLPRSWAWYRSAFQLNPLGHLNVAPTAMLMEIHDVTQWRGLRDDHGHASDEHLNLRVWYEPAAVPRVKATVRVLPTVILSTKAVEQLTKAPIHRVAEPAPKRRYTPPAPVRPVVDPKAATDSLDDWLQKRFDSR